MFLLGLLTWVHSFRGNPPRSCRLAGILYMHKITDNRMSQTAIRQMNDLARFLREDKKAYRLVVFVTTMWSNDAPVRTEQNERLAQLKNEKTCWKPFMDAGADTREFDNSSHSAWKTVDFLISRAKADQAQQKLVPAMLLNIPKGRQGGKPGLGNKFLVGIRNLFRLSL
jgi:hypothetical protein